MRRGGPNSSVRTSFRWSAVLTLTILSFIPFAALFFFMASYFLRTKQAQGQIMKQQNSIALSSQQVFGCLFPSIHSVNSMNPMQHLGICIILLSTFILHITTLDYSIPEYFYIIDCKIGIKIILSKLRFSITKIFFSEMWFQEKISSTEVSDTIKEKSLLYNSSTQSRQQPLKQATIVDELQHCDGQNDTNGNYKELKLRIS